MIAALILALLVLCIGWLCAVELIVHYTNNGTEADRRALRFGLRLLPIGFVLITAQGLFEGRPLKFFEIFFADGYPIGNPLDDL